jgi:hypothetical protein
MNLSLEIIRTKDIQQKYTLMNLGASFFYRMADGLS